MGRWDYHEGLGFTDGSGYDGDMWVWPLEQPDTWELMIDLYSEPATRVQFRAEDYADALSQAEDLIDEYFDHEQGRRV